MMMAALNAAPRVTHTQVKCGQVAWAIYNRQGACIVGGTYTGCHVTV
jgi:hypothetical protein